MEEDFAATRYRIDIEDLLLQVSAMVQKAGCGKRIDAEAWLINWLDAPNPAFNGVCPGVLLQLADVDPAVPRLSRSDNGSAVTKTAGPVSTRTSRQ